MTLSRCATSILVVSVLASSLSACGSGSDDPVQETPDSQDTSGTDTGNNDGNNEDTNPTDTSDLTDPVFGPAEIVTAECGSIALASTQDSNSTDSPAQIVVGEPVKAQLVPNSQRDDIHIWQVYLEPGNYHIFADASVISDSTEIIGLKLVELDGNTADDENIMSGSNVGFDLRMSKYLEVRNAKTLTFSVSASHDRIHNYSIGIFKNGTAVPSPNFDRCLPMNPISLDTTVSVTLPKKGPPESETWFSLYMESGAYKIEASTSTSERNVIGYSFSALDHFGESDHEYKISSASEAADAGETLESSDTFERDRDGVVWIKAVNAYSNSERQVEFTISKL